MSTDLRDAVRQAESVLGGYERSATATASLAAGLLIAAAIDRSTKVRDDRLVKMQATQESLAEAVIKDVDRG